jgi:hypothetical protein
VNYIQKLEGYKMIYKEAITLIKNGRGCWILDTIKGCHFGMTNYQNGCYGECYANKIQSRYGFDFSKTVNREFKKTNPCQMTLDFNDEIHAIEIIKRIKKHDVPFVRIGETGDPSHDWEHTIKTCEIISKAKKPIVIVTKHWKTIPECLLPRIKKMNLCINNSISALDTEKERTHRLEQFNRLKPFCKSVLRIMSCHFNTINKTGKELKAVQDNLFNESPIIDTIFRCSAKSFWVVNGIIKIQKVNFLNSNVTASIFNKNTYFGCCDNCPEQCGLSLNRNTAGKTV